jgi:hypothetical protein
MTWRFLTLSLSAMLLFAVPAQAATTWTDWTAATNGAPGSAAGTVGGVGVSYSGQLIGSVINGQSNIWAPNSSFTGGTSTVSPSVIGDDLRLTGIGFTGPNTITFGSPVTNPLFAIWSLGAPGTAASFTFNATPTLEAGGPNSLFGGASITVNGNVVSGNEGNGVVQFHGNVQLHFLDGHARELLCVHRGSERSLEHGPRADIPHLAGIRVRRPDLVSA